MNLIQRKKVPVCKVLILITLFFVSNGLSAQKEVIRSMDSLTNLFSEKKCFNGDLLVAVNNKTVYQKAVGFRDNVSKEELVHNSIFNLGSISKPFTSVAILQLQQNGLLNINDKVTKYIPEFPYTEIQIMHLLSHTSGLKQGLDQIEEVNFDFPINNDSLISILSRYQPDLFSVPGSEWIYSNLGYELLAVIIERVSGMKFTDYIQKNIFAPAGMKRTFIPSDQHILNWLPKGVSEHDLLVPHHFENITSCEATAIDSINFVQERKDFLVGSENVYSCMNDLSKFDLALRKNKILSADLQELAYTPFVLASGDTAKDMNAPIPSYFGLGWYISINQDQGRIIWHKGRSYGSRSVFLRNPEKKQVVAATDNFDYPAVDLKAISLLKTLNDELYRNPVLISLVQQLGCETYRHGVDSALVNFETRRVTERQNYYISEEEMINLTDFLLSDEKTDAAKSILAFSKDVFPKSAAVYSEYARILLLESNMDSARVNYIKAVELSGENDAERESSLNNLGYYFISLKKYDFAKFVLKLNIELFPDSANVYFAYAYALDLNNEPILASEMTEKGNALIKDNDE